MCILGSVGTNGVNNRDDVRTIQILLNINIAQPPNTPALVEDGLIGKATTSVIDASQRLVVRNLRPEAACMSMARPARAQTGNTRGLFRGHIARDLALYLPAGARKSGRKYSFHQ